MRILAPVVLLVLGVQAVAFLLDARSAPNQVRKLRGQAELQLQLGQLEEAAQALERARALAPEDTALVVLLARVREGQRRQADALALLREAHERRPDDTTVSVALASTLLARGRALDAAELLEPKLAAIRKIADPLERTQKLLVAGRAAAGKGALLQAEAIFKEAARVDPGPVTRVAKAAAEAMLGLAELYGRSGRAELAEDALKAARNFTPWDTRIPILRAQLLELDGRVSDAIAELARVASDSSTDLPTVNALGETLVRAGRLDEATALADRLTGAKGEEVGAHLRGAVAFASRDPLAVDAAAERAASILPASPLQHMLRGHAATQRGDLAKAREEFEAALRLEPLVAGELALIDLEERLDDRAALATRAARLLERGSMRPWALRALLATWDGSADQLAPALGQLETLLARDPTDGRLQAYLGLLRLASGDPAGTRDLARLLLAPDLATVVSFLTDSPEGTAQIMAAAELITARAIARPELVSVRLGLAQVTSQLHRPDLAAALADAAEQCPGDARAARLLRAQLAIRTGDQARALSLLESAQTEAPDDLGLLLTVSELQLRTGGAAKAVPLLARAAELAPDNALVQARLGRALAVARQYEDAARAFTRAHELDPRLALAFEDGLLHLIAGRADAAAARLRAGLDATTDPRFAAALAAALALDGQLAEALRAAERWRGAAPQAPEGAVLVAALAAVSGDRTSALGALQPATLPAQLKTAVLALPVGREVRAADRAWLELIAFAALGWREEASSGAAAIANDASADLLTLWFALRAAETARSAPLRQRLTARLAAAIPDDLGVQLVLADAHRLAGDDTAQRSVLEHLAERCNDPVVLLRLGMARERTSDRSGAIAAYRATLKDRPADVMALNNLAWLLGTSGSPPEKVREAIALAQEASRLAPHSPVVLDTLGWLLHLDGRSDEAVPHLERAVARAPLAPPTRYHQAAALAALGHRRRAIAALEVALRVPSEWAEATAARALLDRLLAEAGSR